MGNRDPDLCFTTAWPWLRPDWSACGWFWVTANSYSGTRLLTLWYECIDDMNLLSAFYNHGSAQWHFLKLTISSCLQDQFMRSFKSLILVKGENVYHLIPIHFALSWLFLHNLWLTFMLQYFSDHIQFVHYYDMQNQQPVFCSGSLSLMAFSKV